MKTLFLCGVFAEENEAEIIANTKTAVEYSANVFQKKLINGFKWVSNDFFVLSAPLIGSYPNAYKKAFFRGFVEEQSEYEYVKFNNVWGVRNFSRAKALKKALRAFIRDTAEEKLIVVYSVHTPFLEAAAYAKRKDPKIKICLVVPDLPEYMNLNAKQSLLYKIFKRVDIKRFKRFNRQVDSYVLLTEYMKERIDTAGKPSLIVEGIVEQEEFDVSEALKKELVKDETTKKIVYAGKLSQRYGICDLTDAFQSIDKPDYRLMLCGKGDAEGYARQAAERDGRIILLGQVPFRVAKEHILTADLLVNPRKNDEEYTKYSFPSKTVEYLVSGNKTLCYKLDGMKEIYGDFVYFPKGEDVKSFAEAMVKAMEDTAGKKSFRDYALKTLSSVAVAEKIVEISRS